MTPYKEIGECLVSMGDHDYFFRPSFANMMRIGDPESIVQAFYDLHNDEYASLIRRSVAAYGGIPQWLMAYIARPQFNKPVIYSAMNVLSACCDDNVSALIGELCPGQTGRWSFVYRKGAMPVTDMVLIAQSLLQHGIIGKAKVRKLQRHEGAQASSEFNAFEYISAARTHLGMSREEAEKLTMTEFQMLLAAKFPEQKGFTKEEYDAVADDYLAKKARRLAKG
ncbi:hypothetical protein F3J38_00045 [Pantoea sp. Acro-805]|uniref:Uncharacterized protein n=1 Tax=Candidatus Pantoea formicae TaxID=2608355 RepID=A0ABX0QSK0_9GAMM|nr:DUF6246 family protein [Pantoea formicae]NIE98464.1 hypothetical protein [Pantoea formicae]